MLVLGACSSEEPASTDHVWKEQTQTIQRAEEVEATLMQAAEDQKKAIEEQMQ